MLLFVGMVESFWNFFKKKLIKSIKIEIHLNISIMHPLCIEILTNTREFILKGLLKIGFNSDPSKVHNYHLVKVLKEKTNSHLTLTFHFSSFFNPYKQFGMKFNMNSSYF
jgi:hypothetical protein